MKITKLLGLSFHFHFFQWQCQLKQVPLSAPPFSAQLFLTWMSSLEWFTPWEEAGADFMCSSDTYKWWGDPSLDVDTPVNLSIQHLWLIPFPGAQPHTQNNFFRKQNICPELCGSHQKHLIRCCTQKSTRTYKIPLDAHLCLKPRENQIIYRWLTKDPLWGWAGNWVPPAVPLLVVWPEKTPFLMRLNDEWSGTDL